MFAPTTMITVGILRRHGFMGRSRTNYSRASKTPSYTFMWLFRHLNLSFTFLKNLSCCGMLYEYHASSEGYTLPSWSQCFPYITRGIYVERRNLRSSHFNCRIFLLLCNQCAGQTDNEFFLCLGKFLSMQRYQYMHKKPIGWGTTITLPNSALMYRNLTFQ